MIGPLPPISGGGERGIILVSLQRLELELRLTAAEPSLVAIHRLVQASNSPICLLSIRNSTLGSLSRLERGVFAMLLRDETNISSIKGGIV